MTVKTTLSFTDRHAGWIARKVEEGVFATQSAAVAAAIEEMMEAEAMLDAMVDGMADEIRRRLETPIEEYIDADEAFSLARARLAAWRE